MPDILTFPGFSLLIGLTSGILLLAGGFSLFICQERQFRSLYVPFSVMAFSGVTYQIAYWVTMKTPDPELTVTGLKWQVTSLAALGPAFYVFTTRYISNYFSKPFFLFLLTASLLAILGNLLMPYSGRYQELSSIALPDYLWGEEVFTPYGTNGWPVLLLYSQFLTLHVWNISKVIGLYKRKMKRRFYPVLASVITQAVAIVLMLDNQISNTENLFLGGFIVFILASIISVSLGIDYLQMVVKLRSRNTDLYREKSRRRAIERDQEKWLQVVDQTPVCQIIVSVKGNVVSQNQASRHFWGEDLTRRNDVKFLDIIKLQHPDIVSRLSKNMGHDDNVICCVYFDGNTSQSGLTLPNECWLEFSLFPIRYPNGTLKELVITHNDITQEKFATNAIKQIASGIVASPGDSVLDEIVASLARVLNAKYTFVALRAEENPMLVRTVAVNIDGEKAPNFSYSLKDTPCARVLRTSTCIYKMGIQEAFPNDHLLKELGIEGYIGSPITHPSGESMGVIVALSDKPFDNVDQFNDVLDIFASRAGAEINQQRTEEEVRKLAYEDYLTQLPNRAVLLMSLCERLARCKDENTHASMVLIDLDNFKTINDALGHDVGDEVLVKVGHRLRHYLPNDHLLARIGSDEFVVLTPLREGPCPTGCELANRLMAMLNAPLPVGDGEIHISASTGTVHFPVQKQFGTLSELDVLRFADIALSQSKKAGRARSSVFEAAHQRELEELVTLERKLRQAIDDNCLSLHYQPQVDCAGNLKGVEALVRWFDSEMGFISPAKFITLAEESGLIQPLGRWVLNRACEQINQWSQQNTPLPCSLSINISAWQFAKPDFVDELNNIVGHHQLQPNALTLEITETALLQDINEARSKLNLLRKKGFRMSLDDFGTGYSSLAYLRALPLDELKIDKAFIDEITPDREHPLVESIINMGNSLKMCVVAEGVETPYQAEKLHDLSCDLLQGYLFAKPLPAEQFATWLEKPVVNDTDEMQHHSYSI
ncbi:bifunctional diguanylate cyclase/phosphodiesterase [Parasalinivibrio latis]|uniref:sensor domain-containing protein n=1 Tax=Parasalinivibrio latis TaxID=2952610 RepID=UPI0030DF3C59